MPLTLSIVYANCRLCLANFELTFSQRNYRLLSTEVIIYCNLLIFNDIYLYN